MAMTHEIRRLLEKWRRLAAVLPKTPALEGTVATFRVCADELEAALLALPADRPAMEEPTLKGLAFQLGWGEQMTPSAVYNFLFEREQLLRMAMSELETHKSNAATAAQAIRERIRLLRAPADRPPPEAQHANIKGETFTDADLIAAGQDWGEACGSLFAAQNGRTSVCRREAEHEGDHVDGDVAWTAAPALPPPVEPPQEGEMNIFTLQCLKNYGADITCGACMEVAFTGVTQATHTCQAQQIDLQRKISDAGDRRDWEECDRLQKQLEQDGVSDE